MTETYSGTLHQTVSWIHVQTKINLSNISIITKHFITSTVDPEWKTWKLLSNPLHEKQLLYMLVLAKSCAPIEQYSSHVGHTEGDMDLLFPRHIGSLGP